MQQRAIRNTHRAMLTDEPSNKTSRKTQLGKHCRHKLASKYRSVSPNASASLSGLRCLFLRLKPRAHLALNSTRWFAKLYGHDHHSYPNPRRDSQPRLVRKERGSTTRSDGRSYRRIRFLLSDRDGTDKYAQSQRGARDAGYLSAHGTYENRQSRCCRANLRRLNELSCRRKRQRNAYVLHTHCVIA